MAASSSGRFILLFNTASPMTAPVSCSRNGVEDHGHKGDDVADENGEDALSTGKPHLHETGGQHICWNANHEADPQTCQVKPSKCAHVPGCWGEIIVDQRGIGVDRWAGNNPVVRCGSGTCLARSLRCPATAWQHKIRWHVVLEWANSLMKCSTSDRRFRDCVHTHHGLHRHDCSVYQ